MECWNVGSEVRPDTWAKTSSQKTLNAPQSIAELGSDPARIVRQTVNLTALGKRNGRPKAV